MSGYIGPIPVPQGIQEKETFTATAGQTTFGTKGYTDGAFINVYLNGVRLINGTDYTATNGSDVVLTQAASVSDVLDFETFSQFQLVSSTQTTPTFKTSATLKNDTHEDSDGGRESTLIFQGEQSGGEISTLAEIEASHDGTSDDQKGDLIFRTNDGSDGTSPTERMRIDSTGATTITTIGNEDTLSLVSTDADATTGPNLTFLRNSASPADSDQTGSIFFIGKDDAGNNATYGAITSHIVDASNTTEDGRLTLSSMKAGTSTETLSLVSGHVGIGKTSPDVPLDVVADTGEQVVGRFAASSNSSSANNGGAILKIQNTDNTNGNQSTLVFADSTDSSIGGIFGYNTNHSNASGYITVGTRDSGTFAERVRIDHHGIKLNGDTAEDNALSDYEEGTFTATLVGYYGNPTSAVTTTGYYTKIGNMVTIFLAFESADTSGASGDMWATGLPFAHSGPYTIQSCSMNSAGTFPNSSPFGLVSGSVCYFYKHTSNGVPTAVYHNAGTSRAIRVTGEYRTT